VSIMPLFEVARVIKLARFGMDLVEPVGNGVVDSGVTRCHGEDADGV